MMLTTSKSFSQKFNDPELFYCNSIEQEDGLLQLNVKCLTLDNLGYLWVGTEDGLLRYNGYEFKSFLNDPLDSLSIPDDHIRGMKCSNGILWLASNSKGIIYYVLSEGKFYNFLDGDLEADLLTGYKILSPVEDTLIFSTQNNLFIIDDKNDQQTRLRLPSTDKECVVNDGIDLGDKRCWMATTSAGILEVDKTNCELIETPLLKNNTNNSFYKTEEKVFIGTEEGLFVYNLYENTLNTTSLNVPVNCFYGISDQDFYIGTDVGLFHYNQTNESITPQIIKTQDDDLHAQLDINEIIGDEKGNIWIGTEGDGLFHYNRFQKKFDAFKLQLKEFEHTSNISTFQFLPEGDSMLWLGTKYGMAKYDPTTNEFQFYDSENKPLIYTIKKDESNTIWAGGFTSGLLRYNPLKDDFEKIEIDLPDEDVVEIIPIRKDSLWICTWAGGIHAYNPNSGKLKEILVNDERLNRARTSLIDSKGNIWLGTDRGVFCIKPSGQVDHFSESDSENGKLTGNRIFDIAEDNNGDIWFGTNTGLSKLDYSTAQTTLYYKQRGLPNDFIYSVLIAPNNDVWVSTNHGLSVLKNEEQAFTNFTESDGLQHNEFNGKAGYQDKNGNFYFGGISGFNIFKPENIIENPHHPEIYIESLDLFNSPLNKNELFRDEISFKSHENVITLNFAALNYLDPVKCNYTYMMDGFDPDWRPIGKSRSTTYTNLDPGTYTFKVRATNDAGVWSPHTDELTLTIIPPWFATTWFRLLLLIAFLLSGILFYLFQTRKLKREKIQLENIVANRTRQVQKKNIQLQEAFDEAASQRDQVKFLMKELKHRINNNLQIISSLLNIQANKLESKNAIDGLQMAKNRIMAIAQVESKISNDKDTIKIGQFIKEISESIIQSLALENEPKYRTIYHLCDDEVKGINTTLVGLILNELITNVTKYAFNNLSAENTLMISCKIDNSILEVVISDTGKGYNKDQVRNNSMGLSLVENMVKQMDGNFEVEHEVGTKNVIIIPLKTL